ncbi:peptidoglycan D,D-transpeptidase FtsI family protein [Porcipelethomonas sp.]|uniref:peptidoglycan D,D-transpeptidase FtsI family protein n=1 Tax=Porcipelethomonas sp. TaxID=2981675 RepID=UPI003EF1DD64
MYKRLIILAVTFAFMFSILYMRIYVVVNNNDYLETGKNQGTYKLTVGNVNGNIYDRNYNKLVNNKTNFYAAINPTADAAEEILPHIVDRDEYYSKLVYGSPFVCQVDSNKFDSSDITVFEVPERYSENQIAQHIIGYVQDGKGVTGIEAAYDEFLRSNVQQNTVTYGIDGQGTVLEGIDRQIEADDEMTAGVVLTIDKYIQAICELAGSKMEKGAVVVMDIHTGDILGMASVPGYSTDNLEDALNDENSPLINRCLYSYNVGSIFKLITAQAAFEQGLNEDFTYNCTGYTEIDGQIFKCHDIGGHGIQNMTEAMTNSCNTYFIELSKHIDNSVFLETAEKMGFGRSIPLASGIIASGGNLQTLEDLELPAEKANFSFGQGKLLASPVQICAFTAAIANEGKLFVPRLVKGITQDGKEIVNEEDIKYSQVMDRTTAFRLQDLMIAAVSENENSNARPGNTYAAGKTSTAQTGRFGDDGVEICHGWITGYFPVSEPRYAVTVLCEDGGYGNDCAAPVFKEIAERITNIYK